MGISMDTIPKSKNELSETGNQVITIETVETGVSKGGNPMMTVSFQTKSGTKFKEFYLDKLGFMRFKLGRLILAAGIDLGAGDFSLQDIAKMVPIGMQIAGKITANDRGYATLDYTGNNEGLYTVDELFGTIADNVEKQKQAAPIAKPAPKKEDISLAPTDAPEFVEPPEPLTPDTKAAIEVEDTSEYF